MQGRTHDLISRACDPVAPTTMPGFIERFDREPWHTCDDQLSPWAMWTLVGLVRHWQRQAWVAKLIVDHLQGDLIKLGREGWLGHPPIPNRGIVPGHIEWEYYFHGRGCCVTHRVTGEEIDVDFYDDTPDHMIPWFYTVHLKSLKKTVALPEARVMALHPSFDTIGLSMDELTSAGWLISGGGREPARIGEAAKSLASVVSGLDQIGSDLNRAIWIGANMGDWLLVEQAAVKLRQPEIAESARKRAVANAHVRSQQLQRMLASDGSRRADILMAMHETDSPTLAKSLESILAGPPNGEMVAAFKIIEARNESSAWLQVLYALLLRLDPNDDTNSSPYLWSRAVALLLKNGHRVAEVGAMLPQAKTRSLTALAMLAVQHAPEHAMLLFRRALRSEIKNERMCCSAMLGVVDRDWTRRELVAFLSETEDWEMAMYVLAALDHSTDPAARAAVESWRARFPHEPEVGNYITMREQVINDAPNFMRWLMADCHEEALSLREFTPPED